MNCTRTQKMLDAWIDQELDEQTASALSLHIAGCPACATLRSDRENAREVVRELAPRYLAPPRFKQEVLRNLRRAGAAPTRAGSLWQAWSMALAGAAAGMSLRARTGSPAVRASSAAMPNASSRAGVR